MGLVRNAQYIASTIDSRHATPTNVTYTQLSRVLALSMRVIVTCASRIA